MKGPSFVPTPSDVNWYQMRKISINLLINFVLRLKIFLNQMLIQRMTGINTPKKPELNIVPLYRIKETKYKS